MKQPAKEDLIKFVSVFETLALFEAQHRAPYGHGIFSNEELPIPEVMRVITWMKERIEYMNNLPTTLEYLEEGLE